MKLTIEILNIEDAKEAVKLLNKHIDAEAVVVTEKKTPVKKPKPAQKEVKEVKEVSEPVKEVKEVKTAPTTTLADLTTLAKATVATAGRDTVKDLVASFSTTAKLSDVPTEKFGELVEALKGL